MFSLSTLGFIGAVSLITPFINPVYWDHWMRFPGVVFTIMVPATIAAISFRLFLSLRVHHHEYRPFVLSLALFAMCFVGLCISLFPYIVPPHITIWAAAAPASSQWFMLIGVMITLPLIIGYTAYSYWVFRGKVTVDAGYH